MTKSTPEAGFDLDRARLMLVDRGFHEVITYSFVSPEMQALVEPEADTLRLANPLSTELSTMRTSLWTGLLQTARYNQTRQQERVRIFESGLRFRLGQDGLRQEAGLGGLVIGGTSPEQWGQKSAGVDFYDLKADVEALLALTGASSQFRFIAGTHPALHPGQTARIEREGKPVGVMGMLHPSLAARLDLTGDAFLFELDMAPLTIGILPSYARISRFPSIRRDIAIVIDEKISYETVVECIHAAASDLLREVVLFDVYAGQNIDSGRKSLALGLILQSSSQTLTEDLIEVSVRRIVERLTSELGARLRT